jgi:diguanylate cyclase (GGDEF)-like protein
MGASKSLAALEIAVADATADADRVAALCALATELARTGDARRALAHARDARGLALRAGDAALDAVTLHTLARCHFYRGDFVTALELMLDALKSYHRAGDAHGVAIATAGVGQCQYRIGAYEDAIVSLTRALGPARELGIVALEINIENTLGTSMLEAGRAEEAEEHLARGAALARGTDNKPLLTKVLLNRSLVAKRRGDDAGDRAKACSEYEAAHALVAQALDLARSLGNGYDEAYCLGQSGTMLRLLGRVDEARERIQATLALGETLDDAQLSAEALLELGRLESARDPASERRCLEQAMALAERANARRLLADASEALSQHHERAGDFASALAQYKHFHAVREQALATARQHALRAGQLWLDFEQATRIATRYREQAQSLAEDKEALAREAAAFAEASQHDPLTGLLNRRGLDAQIGALVSASEASGTPLAIALIDIDRFKAINDRHSHAVGDVVLKRVGAVIRAHSRTRDLPVRYGGDEFLVVLADVDEAAALPVLRRLKDAIDASAWDDVAAGLDVTLSIGAAARAPQASVAATIADADRALYAAKARGRDCIVVGETAG